MHPHHTTRHPIVAAAVLVAAAVFATSTVTVRSGDTLSEIAARHGVTVAQLVDWNDLDDPDRIYEGSTLIVSEPESAEADGRTAGSAVHVVTAGETLWAIATRFGTTVAQLARANDLADADHIRIGQQLALVESGRATTTTTVPRVHTVAAGETLSGIAARYGMKPGVLARDNGIADPDHIVAGMTLSIGASPDPVTTTTLAPTTTTTLAPPTTSAPTTTRPAAGRDVVLPPVFETWSRAYAVPQDVLEAIAWHESGWAPELVGPDGRLGLTQLSPATVELIEGGLLGRDMDPLDPHDGVEMAARYLRYLIDRTHNEREAIAAWAQGLAGVQRDGVTAVGAEYADAVDEIRRLRS